MITTTTLSFLRNLKKNNNKEWFDKNKDKYLAAKDNVAELTDALLKECCKFEKGFSGLTSKDCIFRIYRDVRFSAPPAISWADAPDLCWRPFWPWPVFSRFP